MKVAKFIIKRGDIDTLIHSLKALAKAYDNPNVSGRFIPCTLLESNDYYKKSIKNFFRDPRIKVVVILDRGHASKMQHERSKKI